MLPWLLCLFCLATGFIISHPFLFVNTFFKVFYKIFIKILWALIRRDFWHFNWLYFFFMLYYFCFHFILFNMITRCSTVGSAHAPGAWGREFKSHHLDQKGVHIFHVCSFLFVVLWELTFLPCKNWVRLAISDTPRVRASSEVRLAKWNLCTGA